LRYTKVKVKKGNLADDGEDIARCFHSLLSATVACTLGLATSTFLGEKQLCKLIEVKLGMQWHCLHPDNVDDRMINKCVAVGGLKAGKSNRRTLDILSTKDLAWLDLGLNLGLRRFLWTHRILKDMFKL
jgi:hypothetical protein